MISHKNLLAVITATRSNDLKFNDTDVHLSYLPLPHIFERIIDWGLLDAGASISFFGGDMLKLKEDLAVVRPTFFASVPR